MSWESPKLENEKLADIWTNMNIKETDLSEVSWSVMSYDQKGAFCMANKENY